MENIRDRGNSDREARQIQEVIRGLQIERTDIAQLGRTMRALVVPDLEGRDIPGTPPIQNRWDDMGNYWEE